MKCVQFIIFKSSWAAYWLSLSYQLNLTLGRLSNMG